MGEHIEGMFCIFTETKSFTTNRLIITVMKTNQEYKEIALSALRGNWTPAVIASIVFLGVLCLCEAPVLSFPYSLASGSSSSVLAILIGVPLSLGLYCALRDLVKYGDDNVTRNMVHIAFNDYVHNLAGILIMIVKVFLWMLLLFIPGFIMGFAYALTPYILRDFPGLSAMEASAESRRMMRGHKMELFLLELSFLGWVFLSFLTCGIGFIWLIPYMYATIGAFYEDVRVESGRE